MTNFFFKAANAIGISCLKVKQLKVLIPYTATQTDRSMHTAPSYKLAVYMQELKADHDILAQMNYCQTNRLLAFIPSTRRRFQPQTAVPNT